MIYLDTWAASVSAPRSGRLRKPNLCQQASARTLALTTVACLFITAPCAVSGALPVQTKTLKPPRASKSAPVKKPPVARAFALTDLDGKRHTLADFKGRPVALFFFCGCEPCHKVADAWGQVQASGSLRSADAAVPDPATALVFLGNADAARAFLDQVRLDRKQTAVLPDGDLSVARSYNALACPRTFVVDTKGAVTYTNNQKDDSPQKGSAIVIASKTLAALRTLTPRGKSQ
jgi:hypothetical protein